jgi:hypothetical protein
LLGGGRNIDPLLEETTENGVNPKIRKRLMDDLANLILPDKKFQVDMEWTGIMGFGEDKFPMIKELESGVFAGIKLGGMGVALGSLVGEELSKLVLQ